LIIIILNIYPLEVLTYYILSKIIFKLILYKHHYFSILIILIGLIFINFNEFKSQNVKFEPQLFYELLLLQYIYPLLDIFFFLYIIIIIGIFDDILELILYSFFYKINKDEIFSKDHLYNLI